jgi:Transglutaminase-like superfamily
MATVRSKAVFSLVLAATLGVAYRAWADRMAHERVPNLGLNEGTTMVSTRAAEPQALVHGGEVIPAPRGGALTSEERAVRARDPEAGQAPTFRPDRVTELEGSVGYFEVFSPAISPFKRTTALDGIALTREGTPVLGLADRGPRTAVPIEGMSGSPPDARPRDAFWGSVVLDFMGGNVVPLPSVSPESRILTLRTEPETALHIERDGADNFYAVLDDPAMRGEVRVVFLTDAPRTYFGADLPTSRADSLLQEIAEMPPSLERRALEFAWQTLSIDRSTAFDVALSRLTEHFRSFEESHEPPTDSGDIFWDLATGKKGVCRHRAYAFVIAAHALGIHARFVQNEAHAWVEVHLPEGLGWMRIDLGGSPRGLDPHNVGTRPMYHSGVPDPLPRPEPYLRAYAQAASQTGRPSEGTSGGSSRSDPTLPSEAEARAAAATESDRHGPETAAPNDVAAAAGSHPPAPGSPDAGLEPLTLMLDVAQRVSVRRGETLTVSGRAVTPNTALREGLRVEALLRSSHGERLLGVTVTHAHGVFIGSFGVPPDLSVGDYRLVVRSPGNARVSPAVAQ